MKIEYLYEAGVFGSYNKATSQSIKNNVKKELTREAANYILEKRCDELAELYLDMLNEVSLQISKISNKYSYRVDPAVKRKSNLVELTNYIVASNMLAKRNYVMTRKEMQLNLIKNVYCNKPAIDYMIAKGCFILPLFDIERGLSFFDIREIIPYKNMTKAVAEAAENIIKSHLSNFPDYVPNIPNNVKIVILSTGSFSGAMRQQQLLFSYMGITSNGVEFKYPGHGSSCLNYILDNYTITRAQCNITPVKSNKSIWKAITDPSPWMFSKFTLTSVYTDISTISADNFYGIKLLKFALDNDIIGKKYSSIDILINDVFENIQLTTKVIQELSNNGLNDLVRYRFEKRALIYSLSKIGKELTSEQKKQEGFDIKNPNIKVYEFDYNNVAEVKSAAKKIIGEFFKYLPDNEIKKIAEDKMEENLPEIMKRVAITNPKSVSSSNKVLLYAYQTDTISKMNIRAVIDPNKMEIDKDNNIVFYIDIDFKIPVKIVNPKYNVKDTSQTDVKKYVYVTGREKRIETIMKIKIS